MFGFKKAAQHREAEKENQVYDFLQDGKWTPDMAQLCRYEIQLIFLADEFQRFHPKHELIKTHATYLCNADTYFPFVVWKKALGEESYPVPMEAEKFSLQPWQIPRKGDTGVVRGELFAVMPHKVFPILDKHRQNGLQFIRKRVPVQVKYQQKSYSLRDGWHLSGWRIQTIEAWMYMGDPDFWNWDAQEYGSLNAVRMFKPNDDANPQYYRFTTAEYNDV